MSRRRRPSPDRTRRSVLGGLGAAAFLGVLGSALRGLFGGSSSERASVTNASPPSEPTTTAPPTTETTTTEPTTTRTQPATTTTQPSESGGSSVLVIEKAGWRAAPEGSGFVEHQIVGIVVHHTAVVLGSNSNAPGRARAHQAYHQKQGWPDLAYHMMIDRNGNIYEGRPLWARGDTFTNYDPTGFFLPCLEGDYNSETPSTAQLESLATVCAWAVNRWAIDPASIEGHRDEASTTCPGSNLYPHISSGDLAARVTELAGGDPQLSYLRGSAALYRVATIEAGG